MTPQIATIVYLFGIVGLFILDRDRKSHTSKALWIPIAWLLVAGTRPVSLWFYPKPVTISADEYNIEANPLNVAIFSSILAVGLIVLLRRRQRVGKLLRANWAISLFFLYCALSTLWSDYPGAAFRHWIRSVGDPVMVLIVLTESEPVPTLKRIFACTGFTLIPLSALVIKYYPDIGRAYSSDWTLMYVGVTDQKNSLGALCLVTGLGFFWRFLEHYRDKGGPRRGRHLLADGIILSMVLWLLWMANSVTSSTCFAMAAAVFAATSLFVRRRRLGVVHFLAVGMVSLSLFALFFDPGGGLVGSLGRNPTLTGRTAIWDLALSLRGSALVGTGFESFWLGQRLKDVWTVMPGIQEAHNGYLEVYLNLGWCGVTLLAILIVTGYRNVIVALRRDKRVGELKLAFFVAAVIYSLTEAGFRMGNLTWIFLLLAVAAVPEGAVLNAAYNGAQAAPPPRYMHEYEEVTSYRQIGNLGDVIRNRGGV